MDAVDELRHAVRWTEQSLDVDVDVRAHVFELTIRSLGGLLSAHSLLARDPSLVPGPLHISSAVTLSDSNAMLWLSFGSMPWQPSACRLLGLPSRRLQQGSSSREPICARQRQLSWSY